MNKLLVAILILFLPGIVAAQAITEGGCTSCTNGRQVTISGDNVFMGTTTQVGDLSCQGAAGALTFTDTASSIVVPDNDTTALLIGSTGQLNLITIDSGDDTETVLIIGTTTVTAFHVDVGLALFDEAATFGAGAGAVTFSNTAASVLVGDNDASALDVGSTGATSLLRIDSTDTAEAVEVNGTLRLANDETIVNSTDGRIDLAGVGGANNENLRLDFETTANTVLVTSGTGVTTLSMGTVDLSLAGGAGAITWTDSASSEVLPDNDATALDVGAAGATAMLRFDTTNSEEKIIERAAMYRSPAVFETFGVGDGLGIATLQLDGTPFDGATGIHNIAYFDNGNALVYASLGAGQTLDIDMDATGLDVAGDQTADEGYEIRGGVLGASGRPFVVGQDAAFQFCASVTITDVSGTDEFHIGFRRPETINAAYDNYLDLVSIGIVTAADPALIQIETIDDNAATVTTSTTDTVADGVNKRYCILVSAAGAVTYTNDGNPPTATAAVTIDSGDPMIPFIYLLHDAGLADEVIITEWDVSYQ